MRIKYLGFFSGGHDITRAKNNSVVLPPLKKKDFDLASSTGPQKNIPPDCKKQRIGSSRFLIVNLITTEKISELFQY